MLEEHVCPKCLKKIVVPNEWKKQKVETTVLCQFCQAVLTLNNSGIAMKEESKEDVKEESKEE